MSMFQSSRADSCDKVDRPWLDLISARMNEKVKERGNHIEQKLEKRHHLAIPDLAKYPRLSAVPFEDPVKTRRPLLTLSIK